MHADLGATNRRLTDDQPALSRPQQTRPAQRLIVCRLCATILFKEKPASNFPGSGCLNRCSALNVILPNRTKLKLFPPGGNASGHRLIFGMQSVTM
jgi:hypothetical protein